MIQYWNRFSREFVKCSSLKILKIQPGITQSNLLYFPILRRGIGLDDLQGVPSSHILSKKHWLIEKVAHRAGASQASYKRLSK